MRLELAKATQPPHPPKKIIKKTVKDETPAGGGGGLLGGLFNRKGSDCRILLHSPKFYKPLFFSKE